MTKVNFIIILLILCSSCFNKQQPNIAVKEKLGNEDNFIRAKYYFIKDTIFYAESEKYVVQKNVESKPNFVKGVLFNNTNQRKYIPFWDVPYVYLKKDKQLKEIYIWNGYNFLKGKEVKYSKGGCFENYYDQYVKYQAIEPNDSASFLFQTGIGLKGKYRVDSTISEISYINGKDTIQQFLSCSQSEIIVE